MGSNLSLRPNDLYGIADALQMDLSVIGTKVTGKEVRQAKVPDLGFKIRLDLTVVSSRANPNGSGQLGDIALIVKIRGDLHLLVLEEVNAAYHVFVLDRNDFPEAQKSVHGFTDWFENRSDQTLAAMLPGMLSKAKAAFWRSRYGQTWRPGSSLAPD